MADVREDILARLVEVVATIPGMRSAHRNNIDIPEDQLPGVTVVDGDEEANEMGNRASNSAMIVQMTPDIVVQVQDDNAVMGTTITTFRQELIKRVLKDAELNDLIARSSPRGNGSIRYVGCGTDVGWLRTGWAALIARFQFKYTLRPDDL